MGCGVDWRERENGESVVFFTLNGMRLGTYFLCMQGEDIGFRTLLADFLGVNRTEFTNLAEESISCGGVGVEGGGGACEFWRTGFSV